MKKTSSITLVKIFVLTALLAASVYFTAPAVYADAFIDPDFAGLVSVDYDVVVNDIDGDGYLYLRADAGTYGYIIETIYDGTTLHITSEYLKTDGTKWGFTEYYGKHGYVNLKYTLPAGSSGSAVSGNYDVVVKDIDGDGYLYLRSGPGKSYSIITTIYDGTQLHISSATPDGNGNTWGYTTYGGNSGYVNLAYTTTDGVSETSTPGSVSAADYDVIVKATDGTDYLYLRDGPSMSNAILTTIYNDTVLHITGLSTDSNGTSWGQTTYNGVTGYVSLKHTTAYVPTPTPTPEPTETPTPEPTPEPAAEPTKAPQEPEDIALPDTKGIAVTGGTDFGPRQIIALIAMLYVAF